MHINLDDKYVVVYKYPSLLKEVFVFSLMYYFACSSEFFYYIVFEDIVPIVEA